MKVLSTQGSSQSGSDLDEKISEDKYCSDIAKMLKMSTVDMKSKIVDFEVFKDAQACRDYIKNNKEEWEPPLPIPAEGLKVSLKEKIVFNLKTGFNKFKNFIGVA